MENKIFDVTSLNNYIKNLIEGDFKLAKVLIKGEISNLNKHYTGHYYFTLKDASSKINCTMFSTYVNRLKDQIKDGDEVLIVGKVGVYDKQGTYQLYVYNIEPYGKGKYLIQLEELKRKLKEEGLFDKEKKPISKYPKTIGLVTSKSGAAVQDLIHTINLRWPCEIIVFPCLVQGEDAPKSIIKCLKHADLYNLDTIILARGGGANEDLKAFNDEELVRTIVNLKTPLISAIGHQIDTSLVDYVSDYHCITPTEAGEVATPNIVEIKNYLKSLTIIANKHVINYLHNVQNSLLQTISRIDSLNPNLFLKETMNKMVLLKNESTHQIKFKLESLKSKIDNLKNQVEMLNPLKRLNDGYLLAYKEGRKILSVNDVDNNDLITLQLKDGIIKVKVEGKEYGK